MTDERLLIVTDRLGMISSPLTDEQRASLIHCAECVHNGSPIGTSMPGTAVGSNCTNLEGSKPWTWVWWDPGNGRMYQRVGCLVGKRRQ
jgi:hypothetical protein